MQASSEYEPVSYCYFILFIYFFYTETVKSVKKLISLLQIAVNSKIHVQLLTSDRFVVYIISRKWSECTLQS